MTDRRQESMFVSLGLYALPYWFQSIVLFLFVVHAIERGGDVDRWITFSSRFGMTYEGKQDI